MKRCTICRTKKQLSEFYCTPPNRGSRPAQPCKDCHNARVRRRRRNNPVVREHDRIRNKRSDRRAMAKALAVKWDHANPEKARARWKLNNAIRAGRIKRGPCVDCGSRVRVWGIHPDYSKPLEVIWRCALCHHRGRFADVPDGTALIVIDTFNSKEQRA